MTEYVLTCWADNLEDTDWFGKIQAYFVLHHGDKIYYTSDSTIQGTTPVWPAIKVDLPKYKNSITVSIYDKDVGSADDLLGSVQVDLPFTDGKTYTLGENKGTLVIGPASQPAKLEAWADQIPKSDLLGKSDPLYKLYVNNHLIYTSEHQANTATPLWDPATFNVPLNTNSIQVKVFDHDLVKNDLLAEGHLPFPFRNGEYKLFTKNQDGKPAYFNIGHETRQLNLKAWAKNLKNTEIFDSKMENYYQVVYGDRVLITSKVLSSQAILPVWKITSIQVPVNASAVTIRVYDQDTLKDDLIGSCQVEIPKIGDEFLPGEYNLIDPEDSSKTTGKFIIGDALQMTTLNLSAENLKKSDLIGKSDPYFVVKTVDDSPIQLFKSKVEEETLYPTWETVEFQVPVNIRKLKIEIYDHDLEKDDVLASTILDFPFQNGVYNFEDKSQKKTYPGKLIVGSEKTRHQIKAWANNLPNMDFWGRPEVYYKVKYGDRTICRSQISEGKTPVFARTEFEILSHVSEVVVELYDQDIVSDDLIGKCVVNLPIQDGEYYLEGGKANADSLFIIGLPAEPIEMQVWADNLLNSKNEKPKPSYKVTANNRIIYESSELEKTSTPVWHEAIFTVPVNCDSLEINIFDHGQDHLGQVMIPFPLKNGVYEIQGQKKGIFVVGNDQQYHELKIWADGLTGGGWFDKLKPYFQVKFGDRLLYESKVSTESIGESGSPKTPVWEKTTIMIPTFAKSVDISIWDSDTASSDDLIGYATIPVPLTDGQYKMLGCKNENALIMIGPAAKPAVLHASAEDLKGVDLVGKSDPYYEIWSTEKTPRKLATSNVVNNCHTPEWEIKELFVPVNADQLLVKIYDEDPAGDDLLGQTTIPYPFVYTMYNLQDKAGQSIEGKFIIGKEKIQCQLNSWCNHLHKMDLWGRPDVYYKLKHRDRVVYKSEVSKGKTPVFEMAEFSLLSHIHQLTVEVFDQDAVKDDLIGTCTIPIPIADGEYKIQGENSKDNSVFVVGQPAEPTKLQAWCDQLVALDSNGKSDPYFTVTAADTQLYKSETYKNTNSPFWKEAEFRVPVNTNALEINIFDHDLTSKDDHLGHCIVPYPLHNTTYNLTGQESGLFIVGDEKLNHELEIWADGLVGGGWFDKLAPYFQVKIGDRVLFKSEISKASIGEEGSTKTPVWEKVTVAIPQHLKFVEISIWDQDNLSSDDLIGYAMVSVPFVEGEYKMQGCKNQDALIMIGPAAKAAVLNASAEGLKDTDLIGKSDPYYEIWSDEKTPRKLAKSNTVKNCQTPEWAQEELFVPVNTEQLVVKVFDSDPAGDDLLGQVRIPFPFVNGEYILTDAEGVQGKCGKFLIGDEKIEISNFKAWGQDLKSTDLFGSIDPYFKIRYGDRTVYQSEKTSGKTPIWQPANFKIPKQATELNVKVYDSDTLSSDDLIGTAKLPIVEGSIPLGTYPLLIEDDETKPKGNFNIGDEQEFSIHASANGLRNMDFLGKSDPYFKVSYYNQIVYTSEESDDFAAPIWKKAYRALALM